MNLVNINTPVTICITPNTNQHIFRHLPPEMQMTLRVRKSLERKNTKLHLRYLGIPEIGDRPTSVRTNINFMVSESAVEFLSTLGFELDYDFIAQGYIFQKGIMKITMSKIYKTSNRFTDDVFWCGGTQTPMSNSYLVDMSVLAPSGMSSTIGQNMKQFADQLMPLLRMEKIDNRATYSRVNSN